MSNYVRNTTVTFSHYFVDAGNNPHTPLDTTYPTIQIEDANGSIVASGVALATANPGEYSWNWAVNANATLGSGWSVKWVMTDINYDNHEYTATFSVVDQVEEPTSLDRFQGYLMLKGQNERLIWQAATDPTDLQVTLKDQNGDDVWTKVKADLTSVTADGYVTYYYDTTASTDHATEGQYLAVWRSRNSASSPWQNQVQWLIVPYDVFWYVQPSLKMLVDKLNKVTTTPLSYVDLEYWQAYTQGIGLCNSVVPLTGWTWANFPPAFYVYWVYAASLYLLQSRQLLEIELSHCLAGDSWIDTPYGLKQIKKYVEDTSVCSCCENKIKVNQPGLYSSNATLLDAFGRSISANKNVVTKRVPTFRATTRLGYSLRGTAKQKVLTINESCELKWKNIPDLEIGDHIAVSTEVKDSKPVKFKKFIKRLRRRYRFGTRAKPHKILPTTVTPELARLLGFLVSDGGVSTRYTISFTNTNKKIVRDYIKCFKKTFGITPKICKSRKGSKDTLVYDCLIHNVVIRDFLEDIGLKREKARYKEVPWSIMESPLNVAKHFLRAAVDGDGCTHISGLKYTSTSHKLLSQIQILLLRFGVASRNTPPKKIADGLNGGCVKAGYISVSSHYEKYVTEIGFNIKKNKRKPLARPHVMGTDSIPYVMMYLKDRVGDARKLRHVNLTSIGQFLTTVHHSSIHNFSTHGRLPKSYISEYFNKYRSVLKTFDLLLYKKIKKIISLNVVWDEVKKIDNSHETVTYDVCLPPRGQLPHSFIANGFIVHNSLSGQTVSLDYNHADPLSEIIGRFENYLYERMVPAKTAAFRQSSNVAVTGVRPLRLNYRTRVFRIGSSSNMLGEMPGLLDNLGIWV